MGALFIIPSYFAWHYGRGISDLVRLYQNYIWFFFNFFSINLLVKTFFAPWQRIAEHRSKAGIDFEDIAEVLTINIIMRLVGMMIRTIFIVIGSICVVLVAVFGALFFVVWLLLPVLVPVSIIYGLSFLI
jgi:hypothetical protein